MNTDSQSQPISPCVKECLLNKEQICLGCHRSIEEIINWMNLSEEQQREITIRCSMKKHST